KGIADLATFLMLGLNPGVFLCSQLVQNVSVTWFLNFSGFSFVCSMSHALSYMSSYVAPFLFASSYEGHELPLFGVTCAQARHNLITLLHIVVFVFKPLLVFVFEFVFVYVLGCFFNLFLVLAEQRSRTARTTSSSPTPSPRRPCPFVCPTRSMTVKPVADASFLSASGALVRKLIAAFRSVIFVVIRFVTAFRNKSSRSSGASSTSNLVICEIAFPFMTPKMMSSLYSYHWKLALTIGSSSTPTPKDKKQGARKFSQMMKERKASEEEEKPPGSAPTDFTTMTMNAQPGQNVRARTTRRSC
ncbi:hypothetical protein T310_10276, partial [Rasamsonia emersonii CBS 393.64]